MNISGLGAAILLIANGDIMGASRIVNTFLVIVPKNDSSSSSNKFVPKNLWMIFFIISFGITANIIEFVKGVGGQGALLADRSLEGEVDGSSREEDAVFIYANDTYVSLLGIALGGLFTGFGTKVRHYFKVITLSRSCQNVKLIMQELIPSFQYLLK